MGQNCKAAARVCVLHKLRSAENDALARCECVYLTCMWEEGEMGSYIAAKSVAAVVAAIVVAAIVVAAIVVAAIVVAVTPVAVYSSLFPHFSFSHANDQIRAQS